jgi:hypothetical protein
MSDHANRLRAQAKLLDTRFAGTSEMAYHMLVAAEALDKAEADIQKLSAERDEVASWARRCAELVTTLRRERDAAEAIAAAARPLATLGLACLDEARQELGDLDGGWLEDKATELGVLTAHEVTEPCRPDHEGCRCAEYGFPCICYRDSEAVKAYRALVAACEK